MKILILSVDPWKQNNSFGNTYSNLFSKIENIEIAHVYLLDGSPDIENNISCYYQIPESEIISSVLKFPRNKHRVGREIYTSEIEEKKCKTTNPPKDSKGIYSKLLNIGKRHHWGVMFTARELAWKIGNINYDGLFNFIERFNPDLFLLAYYNVYNSNHIAQRICRHFDIPMVMVMMMDHYSLKRISWNPFFWIGRFKKRAMIRRLVSRSEKMFVISRKLKEEIERDLHIPCKILYKIPDETRSHQPYIPHEGIIKFLFTGNIYANRWKCLAMLAEELKENRIGKLDIYTATPITKKMLQALNIEGVSELHEPVNQDRIIELQNAADVLIHTESLDKKNRLLVRCAISTKIMDYLSVGRCILAIGPKEVSSFEYLEDNDLALIASSKEELSQIISDIAKNRAIISEYAKRSHEYVNIQLDPKEKRKDLHDTLQAVIDNYKKI